MIGQTFGRLTVLEKSSRPSRWVCRCSCGETTETLGYRLKSGNAKSCGCYARDRARETLTARNFRHGHCVERQTSTYRIWAGMIERCHKPSDPDFAGYGGRGIRVCEHWMDFRRFLADMGERPPGLTLDRIDNDGNYEPGNCRWATRSQQNLNTRRSRKNRGLPPARPHRRKELVDGC